MKGGMFFTDADDFETILDNIYPDAIELEQTGQEAKELEQKQQRRQKFIEESMKQEARKRTSDKLVKIIRDAEKMRAEKKRKQMRAGKRTKKRTIKRRKKRTIQRTKKRTIQRRKKRTIQRTIQRNQKGGMDISDFYWAALLPAAIIGSIGLKGIDISALDVGGLKAITDLGSNVAGRASGLTGAVKEKVSNIYQGVTDTASGMKEKAITGVTKVKRVGPAMSAAATAAKGVWSDDADSSQGELDLNLLPTARDRLKGSQSGAVFLSDEAREELEQEQEQEPVVEPVVEPRKKPVARGPQQLVDIEMTPTNLQSGD